MYNCFLAVANRQMEGYIPAKAFTDICYLTHRHPPLCFGALPALRFYFAVVYSRISISLSNFSSVSGSIPESYTRPTA